mmetsp:Transcript_5296/g.8705  ORF Transcript_5296/g.8705 Transcript_5296/m.8705 type:complete len:89 (+) Transcript_5296:144-410(+)
MVLKTCKNERPVYEHSVFNESIVRKYIIYIIMNLIREFNILIRSFNVVLAIVLLCVVVIVAFFVFRRMKQRNQDGAAFMKTAARRRNR